MTQWFVYLNGLWQPTSRPAHWHVLHRYPIALGEWWKEAA